MSTVGTSIIKKLVGDNATVKGVKTEPHAKSGGEKKLEKFTDGSTRKTKLDAEGNLLSVKEAHGKEWNKSIFTPGQAQHSAYVAYDGKKYIAAKIDSSGNENVVHHSAKKPDLGALGIKDLSLSKQAKEDAKLRKQSSKEDVPEEPVKKPWFGKTDQEKQAAKDAKEAKKAEKERAYAEDYVAQGDNAKREWTTTEKVVAGGAGVAGLGAAGVVGTTLYNRNQEETAASPDQLSTMPDNGAQPVYSAAGMPQQPMTNPMMSGMPMSPFGTGTMQPGFYPY